MISDNQKKLIKYLSFECIIAYNSLAKDIEMAVNSFTLNVDEIATEIMGNKNAKTNFDSIATAWILKMASQRSKNDFDERNRISCEISEILSNNPTIAKWLDEKCTDTGKNIAFCMKASHRTLQQSFASLCFRYITMRWEEEGLKENISYMENMICKRWWKTPLV